MRLTLNELDVAEIGDGDGLVSPKTGHQGGTSGRTAWNWGSTEILTIADVAAYLKLPVSTTYRLVQRGDLPGHKLGRQWRFQKGTLERWFHCEAERSRRSRVDRGVNGAAHPGPLTGRRRWRREDGLAAREPRA